MTWVWETEEMGADGGADCGKQDGKSATGNGKRETGRG